MAKILLIDDDADLRQFLQEALAQRGHQVRCLERAEGGVGVLAAGEFDLVLVDENMPGLSGSQFLKALRSRDIPLPAILMTGLATSTLIQPMKELGAFVVPKPACGYGELLKNLEVVLDDALQGEVEIAGAVGRMVQVALKAGKTGLFFYLRELLNRELYHRVVNEIHGDPHEARRILGVPLSRLVESEQPLSFQTEALLLIGNHPELSADQIAERLDCSRSKLYRDPIIKQALKHRHAVSPPPTGYKKSDGDIEAWDQ